MISRSWRADSSRPRKSTVRSTAKPYPPPRLGTCTAPGTRAGVLWALDARYPRSRGPARLEDAQRHGSTPRGPLRHVPEREPHREDPHGGEQRVPLPVALPARTRVVAPPVELERHAGPCIERIEHE